MLSAASTFEASLKECLSELPSASKNIVIQVCVLNEDHQGDDDTDEPSTVNSCRNLRLVASPAMLSVPMKPVLTTSFGTWLLRHNLLHKLLIVSSAVLITLIVFEMSRTAIITTWVLFHFLVAHQLCKGLIPHCLYRFDALHLIVSSMALQAVWCWHQIGYVQRDTSWGNRVQYVVTCVFSWATQLYCSMVDAWQVGKWPKLICLAMYQVFLLREYYQWRFVHSNWKTNVRWCLAQYCSSQQEVSRCADELHNLHRQVVAVQSRWQ